MPLTADNIVGQNSGTSIGSGSATITSTTAGNTVVLLLTSSGGGLTAAGFTTIRNLTLGNVTGHSLWKNTAGGETSFAYGATAGSVVNWVVLELSEIDQINPVDANASAWAVGTGATLATNPTASATSFDGMVISVHVGEDLTSPTPGTWTGHTAGLDELIEIGGNNGTISLATSVGFTPLGTYTAAPKSWTVSATKTMPVGQSAIAHVFALTSASAKYVANIVACTGFENGTFAGVHLGGVTTGSKVFDAVNGAIINTTQVRSGTYSMELTGTAAARNVLWQRDQILNGVTSQIPLRLSLFFKGGALPTADLVLFTLEPATAADNVVVRYINASQKIGVKVGTGAEVVSDAVVTHSQWISIDMRMDGRTTTGKCDWQIDYDDDGNRTEQTQATGTTVVVTAGWHLRLGWTAASTGSIVIDDVAVGNLGAHYPLGNIIHEAITVDPAGTVTLSGTSTNFQTFTGNGSAYAAWNATTARDAVTERPPLIGGTATGFAQVANSTTNYVELPMTTFNVASTYKAAIRGIRMIVCGHALSTTASALGFRTWDGTTETITLSEAADSQFDNSTTAPAWVGKMAKTGVITQAQLDALAFRVGFSSVTTQKPGIHNIIGEVCMRVGDLVESSNSEDLFFVHFRLDPDSSGIISFVIRSDDPVRGATFSYEILGVAQTPVYCNPSSTEEIIVGATDITTITATGLIPDGAE